MKFIGFVEFMAGRFNGHLWRLNNLIATIISSKVPPELSEVNVLITRKDTGFKKGGLKVDSLLQLY
ncbi:MAG: hypothetical protein ACOC6R_02145 [Chloroflexota bacterium]